MKPHPSQPISTACPQEMRHHWHHLRWQPLASPVQHTQLSLCIAKQACPIVPETSKWSAHPSGGENLVSSLLDLQDFILKKRKPYISHSLVSSLPLPTLCSVSVYVCPSTAAQGHFLCQAWAKCSPLDDRGPASWEGQQTAWYVKTSSLALSHQARQPGHWPPGQMGCKPTTPFLEALLTGLAIPAVTWPQPMCGLGGPCEACSKFPQGLPLAFVR